VADKEGTQFLVVLDVTPCHQERIAVMVPQLRKLLDNISIAPVEPFFRSQSLDLFGFFIRSKLNANQILSAVESPQRSDFWHKNHEEFEPFLTSDDHVAIVQVGPECATRSGFTRALTWVQRH
jgi:hypothetical protein